MTRVTVTGSMGFIGSNLCAQLREREDIVLTQVDLDSTEEELLAAVSDADMVFHLAGVNRTQDESDFQKGNVNLTRAITKELRRNDRPPILVVTSSVQAERDNPYGRSKLQAEADLAAFRDATGATVYVFRLPNVFGKWSRPHYNSVVATFCDQVAHGVRPTIHEPAAEVEFVYIDDVIQSFTGLIDGMAPASKGDFCTVTPTYSRTVGELARTLEACSRIRVTGAVPDFSDKFNKYLYATFLSFVEADDLRYRAEKKEDARGYLFEFLKSRESGQIFISRTKPGIVRGNHYHHTKVEKFCVVDGTGRIRLRHLRTNKTVSFEVCGEDCSVVDIPPGYTHSIENVGKQDLTTVFWANEVFDPGTPDTYFRAVEDD